MKRDLKPWFAPQRYGYGVGLPISWEGWAMIGGAVLIGGGLQLLDRLGGSYSALSLALCIPLLFWGTYVAIQRTRGGLRWRWGERDSPVLPSVDRRRSRRHS